MQLAAAGTQLAQPTWSQERDDEDHCATQPVRVPVSVDLDEHRITASIRSRLDQVALRTASNDLGDVELCISHLHACAVLAARCGSSDAWPQLARLRTTLRGTYASQLADSLKSFNWPPRFSSCDPTSELPEHDAATSQRVSHAVAALLLLQAWSVQWHQSLPQAPPVPPVILPLLWVIQVVSKPLTLRLRRAAQRLVSSAAPPAPLQPAAGGPMAGVAQPSGGLALPSAPSAALAGPVALPTGLWTAGLPPQWVTAFALDEVLLHQEVLGALRRGGPLEVGAQSRFQGLTAATRPPLHAPLAASAGGP